MSINELIQFFVQISNRPPGTPSICDQPHDVKDQTGSEIPATRVLGVPIRPPSLVEVEFMIIKIYSKALSKIRNQRQPQPDQRSCVTAIVYKTQGL